jgi:hypothetical protein
MHSICTSFVVNSGLNVVELMEVPICEGFYAPVRMLVYVTFEFLDYIAVTLFI